LEFIGKSLSNIDSLSIKVVAHFKSNFIQKIYEILFQPSQEKKVILGSLFILSNFFAINDPELIKKFCYIDLNNIIQLLDFVRNNQDHVIMEEGIYCIKNLII
jgi:hypothetical protein